MSTSIFLYIPFCLFLLTLICFHCFMYIESKNEKEGKLPSRADVIFFLVAPITFIGYIIENPSKKNITIFSIYVILLVIVIVLLVFARIIVSAD